MKMELKIAGFDWDDGNREKCQRHGVAIEVIEELFSRAVAIEPDPSPIEKRVRAIGKTGNGRSVFLVFTLRELYGENFIRPISARYMHKKEIQSYEEENPDAQQ
jgi:uncharacterized DUF497 family protein